MVTVVTVYLNKFRKFCQPKLLYKAGSTPAPELNTFAHRPPFCKQGASLGPSSLAQPLPHFESHSYLWRILTSNLEFLVIAIGGMPRSTCCCLIGFVFTIAAPLATAFSPLLPSLHAPSTATHASHFSGLRCRQRPPQSTARSFSATKGVVALRSAAEDADGSAGGGYALLDSGDGRRLEEFAGASKFLVVDRRVGLGEAGGCGGISRVEDSIEGDGSMMVSASDGERRPRSKLSNLTFDPQPQP